MRDEEVTGVRNDMSFKNMNEDIMSKDRHVTTHNYENKLKHTSTATCYESSQEVFISKKPMSTPNDNNMSKNSNA